MTASDDQKEVGIVVYPGVQLAAVHGLTDLFRIASRIDEDDCNRRAPSIRVSHWSVGEQKIFRSFSSDPLAAPRPRYLILPPTLGELPDPAIRERTGRWLARRHAQGATLVSICSGVFLVAGTGLLDGRVVSTHRVCVQTLAESFPNIGVDVGQRMIEHPRIMTAGGFMAWIDVALVLIGRLLGEGVRSRTAQFTLSGDDGGHTEHLVRFASRQGHGDPAIGRAQELVHLRDGQVSLAAMAGAARLERRTFLRRFRQATGMTPIEYCREIRIARAREVLEAGSMPLKKIAESLGYVDVSSFARAFRRSCGVPPGAYRSLHGGAFASADTLMGALPASAAYGEAGGKAASAPQRHRQPQSMR